MASAEIALRKLFPAGSLRLRYARGAMWSVTGTTVSQLLKLAVFVAAARLLGSKGFGELGVIQNTAGVFGTFAAFGIGLTATKYVAELRSVDPARAGRIIAMASTVALGSGTIISGLCLALAPWLASGALNAPHLAFDLRLAVGLLLLNAVYESQTGALAGFEAFKTIARLNLVQGAVGLPVVVGAVYAGGIHGAVIGMVLAAGVGCALSHAALRAQCRLAGVPIRYTFPARDLKLMWTFSLPATLSTAMVTPVTWAANMFLLQLPAGYSEMGVFNAANQWRIAIAFLPTALAQFAVPLLTHLTAAKEASSYRKVVGAQLTAAAGLSLAAALPVMIFSKQIMALYGPAFAGGQTTLIVLSVAAVLSSVNTAIGAVIVSSGAVWLGLLFNSLWAAVVLATSYALVPAYLGLGLGFSALIAYAAHSVWQLAFIRSRLRQHPCSTRA